MKTANSGSKESTQTNVGLDDASTLQMSGGSSIVTHGVALDTFARTVPTHTVPYFVRDTLMAAWPGLVNGRLDRNNPDALPWYAYNPDATSQINDSVANRLVVTIDGAESWAQGDESGVFGKYADLPMSPATVERWAFWRYDPVASEFDPSMMFEPQVYALEQLSQLFTESCSFHFGYLADIDSEYHRLRSTGPLGRFDTTTPGSDLGTGSADAEPWYQLYHYWRAQIEKAYLTAVAPAIPLVRLPQHLVAGNWRIADVLVELAAQMMNDKGQLHSNIFVSAKGYKRGSETITLGIQGDQAYADNDGNIRFYHPYLQNPSVTTTSFTAPMMETMVTGQQMDGGGGFNGWTGQVVGSSVVTANAQSTTAEIDVSALWTSLGLKGQGAGSWLNRAPFSLPHHNFHQNVRSGEVYSGFTQINSLPSSGRLGVSTDTASTVWNYWSGHTLNLAELTMFMRHVGDAIEPDVLETFIIPKGVLGSPEPLFGRPTGATARQLNQLYNLYSASFSFNENPARTYTAAHLGPTDHILPAQSSPNAVRLAGVPLTTDGLTARERYWTPSSVTDEEVADITAAFLPTVTLDTMFFRSIDVEQLAQKDDASLRAFLSRTLGNVRSMRTKVERPVYVPAGVSAPETTFASGVGLGAIELVNEILLSLGGGTPRFGLGHAGFTDVRSKKIGSGAGSYLSLVNRGELAADNSAVLITQGADHTGTTATAHILNALSMIGIPGISASAMDTQGLSLESELPLALRTNLGISTFELDDSANGSLSTKVFGTSSEARIWDHTVGGSHPAHVLTSKNQTMMFSVLKQTNLPIAVENTWATPKWTTTYGSAIATGLNPANGAIANTASSSIVAALTSGFQHPSPLGAGSMEGVPLGFGTTVGTTHYGQRLTHAVVPETFTIDLKSDGSEIYQGSLAGEIRWTNYPSTDGTDGSDVTTSGYHLDSTFGDQVFGDKLGSGDDLTPGYGRRTYTQQNWGSRYGQMASRVIVDHQMAMSSGSSPEAGLVQTRTPLVTPAELASSVGLPVLAVYNEREGTSYTPKDVTITLHTRHYLYEDVSACETRGRNDFEVSHLPFATLPGVPTFNTGILCEPVWHRRTMGQANQEAMWVTMTSAVDPYNGATVFNRGAQYGIVEGDVAPTLGRSSQVFSFDTTDVSDTGVDITVTGDFTPVLGREPRQVSLNKITSARQDMWTVSIVDSSWAHQPAYDITDNGQGSGAVIPDTWNTHVEHMGYPLEGDQARVVLHSAWDLYGIDPMDPLYHVKGEWSDVSTLINFDRDASVNGEIPLWPQVYPDEFAFSGPISDGHGYNEDTNVRMGVPERDTGAGTIMPTLADLATSDYFSVGTANASMDKTNLTGLAPFSMAGATYVYPDDPEHKMMYRPWRNIVDASIMKELRLTFANDGEDPSPLAGLLGIKTIGSARQFRFADLLDAGQPETFVLEKAMSKTRLIDPSYRSVLTFSKLALLDPSSQRHTIPDVITDSNASLFLMPGRYASAYGSDKSVYNRASIRELQLGRQYQRLG